MSWIIGMARIDGCGNGGVREMKFFEHQKMWYILRFKNQDNAINVANCMSRACHNAYLKFFDLRDNRYEEILDCGLDTDIETGCCATTVVRQCIIEGTGIDPGEFYTWSEINVLETTGLFEPVFQFKSKEKTSLKIGDILVTQTAGTTCVVIGEEDKCKL